MMPSPSLFIIIGLLAPLAGSLGLGLRLMGKKTPTWKEVICLYLLGMGGLWLACTTLLVYDLKYNTLLSLPYSWTFIHIPHYLHWVWSFTLEPHMSLFLFMISSVSFLVQGYSLWYMKKDGALARFIALMQLFTFFMIVFCLTSPENIFQIFLGWEGMGILSYLLISFWHHKDNVPPSSLFVISINRVADIFLFWGLIGAFFLPDTHILFYLAIIIGAMGKSVQIGFHVWLPAAMVGPTPASALIHSATLVTSGVVLLIKLMSHMTHPWLAPLLYAIGYSTCIMAGVIAYRQHTFKGILAYSTISQMGLLMAGLGWQIAPAYLYFHLCVHGFFKALLFLCAAHLTYHTKQDSIQSIPGSLRQTFPLLYIFMGIGLASLGAFPPLAGFVSKYHITHTWPIPLYFFASCLTIGYSMRFFFQIFHPKKKMTTPKILDTTPPYIYVIFGIFCVPLLCGPAWHISSLTSWTLPFIVAGILYMLHPYGGHTSATVAWGHKHILRFIGQPLHLCAQWVGHVFDTAIHAFLCFPLRKFLLSGRMAQKYSTLYFFHELTVIFVMVTVVLLFIGILL